MIDDIADDVVRFTTGQINRLAEAADVSTDDIRRAQRVMPMKHNFLLSLGYVHAQRDPHIARIEDPRRRHVAAQGAAIELRGTWDADATVQSIMNIGRQQAKTGEIVRDEPTKLMGWFERVWSHQASTAPSPAMGR